MIILHDDWRTSRKATAFGGFGAKSKISFQVSWFRNVSWLTLNLNKHIKGLKGAMKS